MDNHVDILQNLDEMDSILQNSVDSNKLRQEFNREDRSLTILHLNIRSITKIWINFWFFSEHITW
ncbi:hypothetical protein HHI36_013436, partial [Cryptolaemus montrouzieri]